ncbi:hypothetical protein [Pseudoxanthomonas winnipegensis]|uniref:Uncharacterized protein n=1 Tax=Pseudoxanthomonas winnipegensis TaxID=2480810 RepID=A0A4Q8M4D4_9GAMM|nr:hypothetical protein [Pseudoxanthomonas winnipegensis]TAA42506.1 hypothetical protein EA655_10795 [Pseudoxanthomonas winnipegensis]
MPEVMLLPHVKGQPRLDAIVFRGTERTMTPERRLERYRLACALCAPATLFVRRMAGLRVRADLRAGRTPPAVGAGADAGAPRR